MCLQQVSIGSQRLKQMNETRHMGQEMKQGDLLKFVRIQQSSNNKMILNIHKKRLHRDIVIQDNL